MNMGLAGSGINGEWHVEIDELIDLGLYGITIGNRQFTLQVFEIPVTGIRNLLDFLKSSAQDESFDFQNAFGGDIKFVNHDGAVRLRIHHEGKHGPNLLEFDIDHTECPTLAKALEEAILEAEL